MKHNIVRFFKSRVGERKYSTILHYLSMCICIACSVLILSGDPLRSEAYSGQGTGVVGDPYLIANCVQLQEMQDDLTAVYALAGDIDCSDTVNWNGFKGFQPVGTSTAQFTGVFDGNNYTISDLTIIRADDFYEENVEDEEYVGLFGHTVNATIQNVHITDSKIKGLRYVGGLVGFSANGTISNVSVNRDVAPNGCTPGYCVWARFGEYGGGIVGYADETIISHAVVGGSVKGSGNTIGGIIGRAGGITLSYATSTADIDGGVYIGGIVGRIDNSIMSHVFASGTVDVRTDDNKVGSIGGGIAGQIGYSTTTHAFASVNVLGYAQIGGLVGIADHSAFLFATSTGDVTAGDSSAGGFVGYAETSVFATTTASGVVSGQNTTGGFVGSSQCASRFTNSVALGNVTGISFVGGFAGETACEAENIGAFFGRAHAHGSVTANGQEVGGFIGRAQYATIEESYATGAVEGGEKVGGFVGYAYALGGPGEYQGTIKKSFATGNVTGITEVSGGFVGSLSGGVLIENSYARGNVTGSNISDGAFVGSMSALAKISYSYATGEVTTSGETLGFVGLFAMGDDMFTRNFWDIETVGLPDSDMFTAETISATTTVAMNNQYTFITAGWDFATIWGQSQSENDGYPYLYYQVVDTSAPILTTVQSIPSSVNIDDAIYLFSTNEACTPLATILSVTPTSMAEVHILNTGNPSLQSRTYVSGLQPGSTYSYAISCIDRARNVSNTLAIGPFTIVSEVSVSSGVSSGSRGGGSAETIWGIGLFQGKAIKNTQSQATSTATSTSSQIRTSLFVRYLRLGMSGADVQELQRFLNYSGYAVAANGPGSAGKETTYFGPATRSALARFQKANGISPAIGYFGPVTRAFVLR